MKVKIHLPYSVVVVKKGVKGFHYSDVIDQHTTICDVRFGQSIGHKARNLATAIYHLTGFGGAQRLPVLLQIADQHGQGINHREYTGIIKYAESTSWSNLNEDPTFQGVIVDNKGGRFWVTASLSGSVAQMRYIDNVNDVYESNHLALTSTPPVKEAVVRDMYDYDVVKTHFNATREAKLRAVI